MEDCALEQTEPYKAIFKLYKEIESRSQEIETRIDDLVKQRDEVNISRDFLLALHRGLYRIDQGYDPDAIRELTEGMEDTIHNTDPECTGGSEVIVEEAAGHRNARAATPIALCVDRGLWNLFTLALKYTRQPLGEALTRLMSGMIRSSDDLIREQLNDEEAHLRHVWELTQDVDDFDAAVKRVQALPKGRELTTEESNSVMGDDYDLSGYMAAYSCVTVRESLAVLDRIRDKSGRSWRDVVSDNLTELYMGKKE